MWTGETIPTLLATGIAAGMCLRFVLQGIRSMWGLMLDGIRSIFRSST